MQDRSVRSSVTCKTERRYGFCSDVIPVRWSEDFKGGFRSAPFRIRPAASMSDHCGFAPDAIPARSAYLPADLRLCTMFRMETTQFFRTDFLEMMEK